MEFSAEAKEYSVEFLVRGCTTGDLGKVEELYVFSTEKALQISGNRTTYATNQPDFIKNMFSTIGKLHKHLFSSE
jgi:hypothetical protein